MFEMITIFRKKIGLSVKQRVIIYPKSRYSINYTRARGQVHDLPWLLSWRIIPAPWAFEPFCVERWRFLCLYDMRVTENHVYLQQLIKDTANEK